MKRAVAFVVLELTLKRHSRLPDFLSTYYFIVDSHGIFYINFFQAETDEKEIEG